MSHEIPVDSEVYDISHYPEIAPIWDAPSSALIVDPASLHYGINFSRIPNLRAVGFFGAQWGDESKGTQSYRYSHGYRDEEGVAVKAGGGGGTGHEFHPVELDDDIVFRMLPAALDPKWKQIVGRGVLARPDIIIDELEQMNAWGYNTSPTRVMIDGAAYLSWAAHAERDKAEEILRGKNAVGTTKSGVGPSESDRVGRHGIWIGDLLLSEEKLKALVNEEVDWQNRMLRALDSETQYDPLEIYQQFTYWAEYLGPYIQNTLPVVQNAVHNGRFMLEAAQAFGISLDTGFRGRVTSTDSGPGLFSRRYLTSPDYIGRRVGVMKLVQTAVGNHYLTAPVPEEWQEKIYADTAERGKPETGRVSGRKRKFSWISIPQLRKTVETYGLTELVIAKVDVLDRLPEIHFGMEYVFPDGTRTTDFDSGDPKMDDPRVRMNTLRLPGWQTKTAGLQNFADAPHQMRALVHTLSKLVGVPISAIGTGPQYEEAIYSENSPFKR